MARLDKNPIAHDITRTSDGGEQVTTTEHIGYFYKILFSPEELADMRSQDAALARRALYIAGMDIGAHDTEDSPFIVDAAIAACEENRIYGAGFPAGSILQGAQFARSLMVAAEKLPEFSFDDWVSQNRNSTEQ